MASRAVGATVRSVSRKRILPTRAPLVMVTIHTLRNEFYIIYIEKYVRSK